MVEVPEQTFSNDEYLDESRLLNTGTSSEDSGILSKKRMPSKIASHEGASSLRKEPLKSWSMQSIPGSTSSRGKWNKPITILLYYSSSSEGSGIVFKVAHLVQGQNIPSFSINHVTIDKKTKYCHKCHINVMTS